MNDLINIRECIECGFILESSIKICINCGFNSVYTIPEHLMNLNYQDITKKINDAFYRVESFMSGRLNEYSYFGFNDAFTKLFFESQKAENCNIENDKLISYYWSLLYQIYIDLDKGIYNNVNICNNEMFNKERKEVSILINYRSHEFIEFDTTEYSDYRITISDITNKSLIDTTQEAIQKNEPYKDKIWFVIGLKFATGEMDDLLKSNNQNFTKTAKFLGNKSFRPFISETKNNTTKSNKNIYSNKEKIKNIYDHCLENDIQMHNDFITVYKTKELE
jgi:Zn ribbon nucleic-acid-binding protein